MRRRDGIILLPWMFILLMICSLFWLLHLVNLGRSQAENCQAQLRRIHQALVRYEASQGHLPVLELFPEEPLSDPSSLPIALKSLGLDTADCVCPTSPQVVRQHGLGYLWNTALNGASLQRESRTWVLVDIQALDDRLPGPHFGRYHILYTDGVVESSSFPPAGLPVHYAQ
jgi:hypothetical protein